MTPDAIGAGLDEALKAGPNDPTAGEEEHPAQVPDASDPPTYGVNNRELPQLLKDTLAGLVKKTQQRDMYDRRVEVLCDRRLRFYDDGIQHFYGNYGTGVYQIGAANATIDLGNGDQMECPEFMGAYNIFRTARRTIDSVLTQNPPGIDFEAVRPGEPEDIQSAEIAEGYRHYFDMVNDRAQIQQEISRMMELSGRTVTWTHSSRNKQRWGENDQGKPRQMETVWVGGTLESRAPVSCREFSKLLFCNLFLDVDSLVLKAENPWIRTKIQAGQGGLGESDWERFARLGVRQSQKSHYLTPEAFTHLTTEMHSFLRPAIFEDKSCDNPWIEPAENADEAVAQLVDDGKGGKRQMNLRDKLTELFPEGAHVKYCGEEYSESWAEAMEDAIDIAFPTERDGMTGGALMEPGVVIQDTFNDYCNAERENYEKGWPVTYFAGDTEDFEAIENQTSKPKTKTLIKSKPGGTDLGALFYTEEGFDIPETFVEAKNALRELLQAVTGALPALQGQSKADQTASGQAMDRAQAMGMLGPAWANIQRLFAGIYHKAALLAAKNPDHAKEIAVPGKDGKKVTLHLEKLKKGSFRAKPSADSSFPESTAAMRQNLMTLLPLVAQTPVGSALFESPDNFEEFLRINGNPQLVLTPAIAYKKQTRELEILLGEPPVDNAVAVDAYNVQHAAQTVQAIAQGMPAPDYTPPPAKLPSLMPEADDYHKWESAKCQEYLSSEDCWLRMNIGTPEEVMSAKAGVENVRLHKAVHDQFLAAAAASAAAQQMPVVSGQGPVKAAGAASGAAHAPEAHAGVQKQAAAPGAPGAATV